MTLNRAVRTDELVEALLGTESRRWIKNLPPEEQGWLAHCDPRQALPEWLLDMRPGGDFIPLADQISAFAISICLLTSGKGQRVRWATACML